MFEEDKLELWILRILCLVIIAYNTILFIATYYNNSNVCDCNKENNVQQENSNTSKNNVQEE